MFNPRNATVSIIEDHVGSREALQALLATEVYRCEAFATASAYLQHGCTHAPCCLVLDMNLPDIDGLALQRQLRAEGRTLPILFISGRATLVDALRALSASSERRHATSSCDADWPKKLDANVCRPLAPAMLGGAQEPFEQFSLASERALRAREAGESGESGRRTLGDLATLLLNQDNGRWGLM